MAARSLPNCWRGACLALSVLVAAGCSSSSFSASGVENPDAGEAGEAGDDADAGSTSAGRAGGAGRAGAGGSAAAGRAGAGQEAGDAGDNGEAGSPQGGRAGGGAGGTVSGGAGGIASGGKAGGGSSGGGSAGTGQAGAPSAGSGGTCTTPVTWYADDDDDTFGRSTSTVKACFEPTTGSWAAKPGDCNDDNKLVYPLAPTYRSTGYVITAGTSFDYDCSGQEDPDPTQLGLAPTCPATFLGCSGTGFKSTGRTGAGVNPVCGSTTVLTCTPVNGIGCEAVATMVPAARCR